MQNLKVKTLVLIFLGVMVVGGLGMGGIDCGIKRNPRKMATPTSPPNRP